MTLVLLWLALVPAFAHLHACPHPRGCGCSINRVEEAVRAMSDPLVLAESVAVLQTRAPPNATVLSEHPYVYIIDDFLSGDPRPLTRLPCPVRHFTLLLK
eukprot:SAG11_NODE_5580_length_1518_cov_1.463002_1_plen_100_part_00